MTDPLPPDPLDTELGIEFAPWDGRRVPVTLVGGYLGAGKTTLINRLLQRTDRPIAVLVNDIGSVNIDAALVRQRSSDTIELTDGCVCCSLSRGLADAFDDLRGRATPPEHVIIELSGVADPRRVMPWGDAAGFRLDTVVVLVDAQRFVANIEDPVVAPHLQAQLDAADIIAITKVDATDDVALAAVHERLGMLAPDVPLADISRTDDLAGFLDTGTRQPGGAADVGPPQLFDAHITSLQAIPDPVEIAALEALISALPADTMRAKGVARLDSGELVLVQVVGRRSSITPLPAAESQDVTGLVVIRLPGAAN
jgi:G3E family GTPase